MTSTLVVDGIDVFIEGDASETIVMLHGWPDTYRLWDSTVAEFKQQFCCVRFNLPGFDLNKPVRTASLTDITQCISNIVDAVSPTKPVTLLLHDWGCMFGYEYQAHYPQRVSRLISVDIGDHNSKYYLKSLQVKSKLQIFFYQYWLAIAWQIGSKINEKLANKMTRWMAKSVGYLGDLKSVGWPMNYPYAMLWMRLQGGLQGCARVKLKCPTLFIYGARKNFMFHSPAWLETLEKTSGCEALGLETGHWVMLENPSAFLLHIRRWLLQTPAQPISVLLNTLE